MNTKELPIGYWIKQADELLTKSINEIQSSLGITRTGWQILHLLMSYENHELQKDLLAIIMQPFINENELESILEHFIKENTLIMNQDTVVLTDKGEQLHNQSFELQKAFRLKSMEGIPGEDYQTTIATLQKIVSNLTELCNSASEN